MRFLLLQKLRSRLFALCLALLLLPFHVGRVGFLLFQKLRSCLLALYLALFLLLGQLLLRLLLGNALILRLHLCLLLHHCQIHHLLLQVDHLIVHLCQGLLCLLPEFRLFGQLGFRIKLCLRDLFYDDLTDLHILQVVIVNNDFFDLFYEFGFQEPAFGMQYLHQVALIRFQQALEHCVIRDQIGIHLKQILFIEFQCTILHFDGIAHAVIIFQKLPQSVTCTVMRLLHDQIGSLDGAAYLRAARKQLTERGIL